MSILGHRVSVKAAAAAIGLVVLSALGTALSQTPAREIRLEARGMAFYLAGETTPNPTIAVKAGERVRVILHNEEPGIAHDFAVPRMNAAMDRLRWDETGDVTITVPDTPGRYEYMCRPHALMMRGTIVVEPD